MAELGRNPGGGPEGIDSSAYEERISQLERVIAEKEHAVMRSVVSVNEVQQQLEASQAETLALKAQLELSRDRALAGGMGEEVSRISAQFALARKSLDRERAHSRAEASAVKTRWQQARRELDHERQMRMAEGTAYSARIASLQRDLASAQIPAVPPQPDARRSVWARLAACALAGALLVSLYVGWLRISKLAGLPIASRTPTPEAGGAAALNVTPVARESRSGRSNETSPRPSQRTPGATTAEWRNVDPSVCNFQRTGGLPTILYSGKDSLVAILGRCTQAVQNARAQ